MSDKDKTAGQQQQNQTEGETEDDDEQLVVVETDSAGRDLRPDTTGDVSDDDDDPDDEDDDDPDDDVDDERRGHAEGDQDDERRDETPEAKKERRRRENRAKRIRNRINAQGRERLLQTQAETIAELTSRIDKIEGRASRQDIGMLRNQLQQIESQQADAKRTHAELAKAGDWEGVAEVNEIQLTLREQHRNVTIALQRAGQALQQTRNADDGGADDNGDRRNAPPRKGNGAKAPDPVVVAKATEWASDKPWLKGDNADPEEVAIVRSIDTVLAQEGISARSDEYWSELTKRVKRRLPHHFKSASNGNGRSQVNDDTGGNKRPQSRGPKMAPASQTGGSRALKPNEVRISPERKQAMIEAGIWDDPAKRNRQLKAYREWDRQHAGDKQ